MKKCLYLFMAGFVPLLLGSCVSAKKVTYVDDMEAYRPYPILQKHEIKIQQEDKLSITVISKNPELAAPFNMGPGTYRINSAGDLVASSDGATTVREKGYLVDGRGDIDFPILGKIHTEGLTRTELGELIKRRLQEENLINDPIVTVELLNLKITLLGEVGRVGVISVDDNRITLLDAIARGGGVTNNGRMENVAVIREDRGNREMIVVDLKSVAIFDSPAFFLQQNDIVYVQPISSKPTPRSENNWKIFSTATGLASLVFTFLLWMKK